VVVVAAVAALRGTAPPRERLRPTESRGLDLRQHAGRLPGPVTEAFTSLTAMDTLADRHPEHRPVVVALLAEHLREHSDHGDDAVTQAVQRCLISQVRSVTRETGLDDPKLDLDLAGARLRDLDLSRVRVRSLTLAHARLAGTTRLSGLSSGSVIDATSVLFDGDLVARFLCVERDLRLTRSVLTNVDLTGAFVQGITDLTGVQVTGSAWLTGAVMPTIRLCASGSGTQTATFTGLVDLQRVVCDDIGLHGTEFRSGLTLTVNQDQGIGREVSAHDPDLAGLVRRALFYEIGTS
jgi:hypothetical protein